MAAASTPTEIHLPKYPISREVHGGSPSPPPPHHDMQVVCWAFALAMSHYDPPLQNTCFKLMAAAETHT